MSDQDIVSELPESFRLLVENGLTHAQYKKLNGTLVFNRENRLGISRDSDKMDFDEYEWLIGALEYAFIKYLEFCKSSGSMKYVDLSSCVEAAIRFQCLAREAFDEQR